MIAWRAMAASAAFCPILLSWGIATASPPGNDLAHETGQLASDDPKATMLAWNRAMLDAIRNQNSAPGLASRNLAILHLAVFNGLKAEGGKSCKPSILAGSPSTAVDLRTVQAGAITGAANHCALLLYPSERARFGALLEQCRSHASNRDAFAAGEQSGICSADAILLERQSDGASRQITYVPSKDVGQWHRTAPKFRPPELPHWKDVTPFALVRANQFRPPPPPALNSAAYARDLAEVHEMGAIGSGSRTADQTEIAIFWSCFNYTGTPAGHWNDIAAEVLPLDQFSALELARAYAVLNIAMADAGIAAWECKYHYRSWRPIQAIPAAADDGNAATSPDIGWQSLLEAPPHPEYVSGHSSFTGAACTVLKNLIGGDKIAFEIRSDSLPHKTRRYSSLSQAAEEIGRSRVYGGIHFQSANREGIKLGSRVATYVIAEALADTDCGSRVPSSTVPATDGATLRSGLGAP